MSQPRGRLRSLIRAANDAGVTYEKMAAATQGLISRGKLHKMAMQEQADGEVPLTVPQLRALAAAIGQPWHVVRDAVLDDAGLNDTEDTTDSSANVTGAILTDTQLLPEARAHLLNQYQLLLRLQASSPEELEEQERRRQHAQVQAEGRAMLEAVPTEPPARQRNGPTSSKTTKPRK